MLPLDLALAAAGWFTRAIRRRLGGPERRIWYLVAGLVILSGIPISFVGSSPRPTNLTFEDVSLVRIPAMTSWVRLEGDLRENHGLLELHDNADDALYLIVIDEGPLPTGHVMITGRISPEGGTTGNIGTIDPDIPPVPPVDEPIWLYLTPAVLAIVLGFGVRAGYPVVRRERGRGDVARTLAPGETVAVRWSGRIGSDSVPGDRPRPARLGVTSEPDLTYLTISEGGAGRTVRARRPASAARVRLCRISGREPGLDVHGQNADLLIGFDDRATRDRVAATLR